MHRILLIESAARGLLYINGQFCGPIEEDGQAFPMGRDAEVYIQLIPFDERIHPVTAELHISGGMISCLSPGERCYALVWPDGIVQLELKPEGAPEHEQQGEAAAGSALLRYLLLRLAGDRQAMQLLMRPQESGALPELAEYETAVPLRFAPVAAGELFDERAGLVRRVLANAAVVDVVLAVTVPAGQGRRMIERMKLIRT